jgi:hypothetical protein
MVIFKAKEYKTFYKKLLTDNNVIKGLIHVECNNTWSTETINKNWLDKILIPYINKNFFSIDGFGYLIMVKATSHWTEDILNKYQKDKSFINFNLQD